MGCDDVDLLVHDDRDAAPVGERVRLERLGADLLDLDRRQLAGEQRSCSSGRGVAAVLAVVLEHVPVSKKTQKR